MEQRIVRKLFMPVAIVFLIINVALVLGKSFLDGYGVDHNILIIGNLIIFLVTLISYVMHLKALNKSTSMGFVNAVYGGMLMKMFVCLIAAFVYIVTAKKGVNKPALFGCMFLYLLYTFLETRISTRLNRMKKDG